ncbi:MAG: hypothetical protein AAFV95_07365 [Bacteroidota bacterium]
MYGKANSKKSKAAKFAFYALVAIGFVLLVGGIVYFLWNAILPDLVGVRAIRYWEAVGLLVLFRILFGGFRSGALRNKYKRGKAWKEKWRHMSDEERAQMKERWRERCKKRKEDRKK